MENYQKGPEDREAKRKKKGRKFMKEKFKTGRSQEVRN